MYYIYAVKVACNSDGDSDSGGQDERERERRVMHQNKIMKLPQLYVGYSVL